MEPLPTVPAPDPAGPPSPTDWSQVDAPGSGPRSGFGVGAILTGTFRTWWSELPAFAVLGLAGSVAGAWATYRMYGEMAPLLVPASPTAPLENLGKLYGGLGGWWFASFALFAIQVSAVTHGAARRLRGAKAGFGQMIGVGLQRSFAMFGVEVVTTLAVLATICTAVGPFMLSCAWAAASAVVVVEGAGPLRALGRSWALTRGHRWKIFAGLAIVYVAVFGVVALLRVVFVGGGFGLPGGSVQPQSVLQAAAVPMAIVQLVSGIFETLLAVACAVIHHGLCLVKEGGDPVHLAQVFE